ncbi:MAG: hypothetical protein ACW96X_09850, partial [Promethearchaeota archaeon]
YTLAKVYYRKEKYNKTLEAIIICLKINPNNVKAIEFYEEILNNEKMSQSNKYAWYFLAKIYYNNKEYRKSSYACENSIKIEDNFKKALKLRKKLQEHTQDITT